jgi:hypothetical protein
VISSPARQPAATDFNVGFKLGLELNLLNLIRLGEFGPENFKVRCVLCLDAFDYVCQVVDVFLGRKIFSLSLEIASQIQSKSPKSEGR